MYEVSCYFSHEACELCCLSYLHLFLALLDELLGPEKEPEGKGEPGTLI